TRRYRTPADVARALKRFAKDAPAAPAAPAAPVAPAAPASRRQSAGRPLRLLFLLLAAAVGLMLLGLLAGAGLLLAYWLGFAGPKGTVVPPPAQPRVLMLLAAENFHNPDYAPVRAVLERDGKIAVKVASSARRARPDAKGGGKAV